MEAPLSQPPQPGVTSPPLRPKPIPPPRNPSFRRGSQDGRVRPDGTRSPSRGSNPTSPPTSPQREPTIVLQQRHEVRGNGEGPTTSPQRTLDSSKTYVGPQQPAETKGSEVSLVSSTPQILPDAQQKWAIEVSKQSMPGVETRVGDDKPNAAPSISQQLSSPVSSVQGPFFTPSPQRRPENNVNDSTLQGTPLTTSIEWVPPTTSSQWRTETNISDTSLQRVPFDRPVWRNEMSTSFSSGPLPVQSGTSANHATCPQQILERSRQGPTSPRWVLPGNREPDVSMQPPLRTRRSPTTSPQRAPQIVSDVSSAHGVPEARLASTPIPNRGHETLADTTGPQEVPGTRLITDATSRPGAQVVSPKRVYSYSVILTGTSNTSSGSGTPTGSGSPSHVKLDTATSPVLPATSVASPLFYSHELPTNVVTITSVSSSTSASGHETRPSAEPVSEGRALVSPASPQRNLTSKPPLPGLSGARAGSSAGHSGPISSASSSLQYIAPKSSLYSGLSPVHEQSHNSTDSVPHGGPISELVTQSGSVLVPESSLASSPRRDAGSLSSLDPSLPSYRSQQPAPDSMSYLDSVSMMSGTVESLSLLDDASSLGSDSEINGMSYRRTDKYGFLGGSQFSAGTESSLSVEVARQRELKWLDMFKHWDKWVSRRFQKVKLRCRKGIPSSLRAKAWQYLSNSTALIERNPGKFEELERNPGDPKWLDVIEKDLHRQFPFHEMFAARGGHGQQDLYRILKAYTIYRPDEGYCQAQAPVAAVLLMHMPAEQAFWCLVQICEKYLPGYYSAGLEAIQLDGEIFFALLRRASPMAYRHLKKYKIDPILYMTEWFMCIFSRTLPWSSVLRVWDMFFCEGVKIIFRVGLVLLRHTLGSVDKLRSCQGMYETMEKLRNLPTEYMQELFLVHEISALPVTEALIERENTTQLKKWRENRGELQYKPSRRLHGTRAIFEEHHRMNPPLTTSSSLLSLTSLRRASKEERWRDKGQKDAPGFSPAHSIGNLALSSGPTAAPSATVNLSSNNIIKSKGQKTKGKVEKADGEVKKPTLGPMPPVQVVSEGLHPALPSPTGNVMPLGEPKKSNDRKKEKDYEKQRAKEQKEKERQDKERERLEKEREKELEKQRAKEQKEKERLDKERERLEKEKEKKLQKEKAKEESKLKKERKMSFRKKESSDVLPGSQEKGTGDASTVSEKAEGGSDNANIPVSHVAASEKSDPADSPGAAVVQDSYF